MKKKGMDDMPDVALPSEAELREFSRTAKRHALSSILLYAK